MQELVAIGISNTVGSFLRCFVTCASVGRTTVQANSGGKSQVHRTFFNLFIIVYYTRTRTVSKKLADALYHVAKQRLQNPPVHKQISRMTFNNSSCIIVNCIEIKIS